MRAATAITILALVAVMSPVKGALSESEIHDLYSEGKRLFRQANEQVDAEPDAARDLFRKAAMRFERIATEGNIRNGKLYYNIGNCYFRMEDLGRAILNYRRAQQFTPNDPNLTQNLAVARSKRLDRIDSPEKERVLKTLFFFHYDVGRKTRTGTFLGAFVFVWLFLAVRLFLSSGWLNWMAAGSAVLATLMFASLAVDEYQLRAESPGVVISGETVARKGDGQSYEPAFTKPLHAGTEFRLLEDRGEWKHVVLNDRRTCWLNEADIAMVR